MNSNKILGPEYINARDNSVIAHYQHFGVSQKSLDEALFDIREFAKTSRSDMRFVLKLFFLTDYNLLTDYELRLYGPEDRVNYTVQIKYDDIDSALANGDPTAFSFPIHSDSFAHVRAPIECTERDCPVEEYHYQGLYMYSGLPRSELSRFGFSDPPPGVWAALKRVQDRVPESRDREMVDRFADYHAWLCTRVGETNIEEEQESTNEEQETTQ